MNRQELHDDNMYLYVTCLKCGVEAKGKMTYWKFQKPPWSYDGRLWCDKCDESICPTCGSQDYEAYDDGEGYPPNILCNNCGYWE